MEPVHLPITCLCPLLRAMTAYSFAGQEYVFTVPHDAPAYVGVCLQNDTAAVQQCLADGVLNATTSEATVLFSEMDEEFEVNVCTCVCVCVLRGGGDLVYVHRHVHHGWCMRILVWWVR